MSWVPPFPIVNPPFSAGPQAGCSEVWASVPCVRFCFPCHRLWRRTRRLALVVFVFLVPHPVKSPAGCKSPPPSYCICFSPILHRVRPSPALQSGLRRLLNFFLSSCPLDCPCSASPLRDQSAMSVFRCMYDRPPPTDLFSPLFLWESILLFGTIHSWPLRSFPPQRSFPSAGEAQEVFHSRLSEKLPSFLPRC